jgi:hypothetical protein
MVAKHVRNQMTAELCTQAWCKFHEVLGTFPDLTRQSSDGAFNTVHLCEAPGAFVASLNHYLTTRGLLMAVKFASCLQFFRCLGDGIPIFAYYTFSKQN